MTKKEYGISLKDFIKKNFELYNVDKIDFSKMIQGKAKKFIEDIEIANSKSLKLLSYQFIKETFNNEKLISETFFNIGLKYDDNEDFEDSLFFYRLSNIINPNLKAINNLAILYADQNKIRDALEILKQGMKEFPDDITLKENLKLLNEYILR